MLGPVALAATFAAAIIPKQESGVYVSSEAITVALRHYVEAPSFAAFEADPAAFVKAPVVASRHPPSFFVVANPGEALADQVGSAALFLIISTRADQTFPPQFVKLATTIDRFDRVAYRVHSEDLGQWGPETASFREAARILGRIPGPRAAIDTLIGVMFQTETPRLYAVRFTPVARDRWTIGKSALSR